MKRIDFEGKQYDFPDDASDAEIGAALENATASPSFATVIGTVPGEVSRQARSLGAGAMMLGADIVGSESLRQSALGVKRGVAEEAAAERPPNMTMLQEGLLSGAASGVMAVPAMVAGALTAPVSGPAAAMGLATTLMGAQTGISRYGDERQAGFLPGRAALHGLLEGLIEKYTEYLPLKELAKGPILWREARKYLVKEMAGEQLATLGQDISAKLSDQPDMTLGDYFRDAMITAIATPIAGGTQLGIVKAGQVAAGAFTPSPVTPTPPVPGPADISPAEVPLPPTPASEAGPPVAALTTPLTMETPPPAPLQTPATIEVPKTPTTMRVYLVGENEKAYEATFSPEEAAALGEVKYADLPFDDVGRLQEAVPETTRLEFEGTTRFPLPKDGSIAWKSQVVPPPTMPTKPAEGDVYSPGVEDPAPVRAGTVVPLPTNTVPLHTEGIAATAIKFPDAATKALWDYGAALTRYETTTKPADSVRLNKLRDRAKDATGIKEDAQVAETAQRYVYGTVLTGLRQAKAGTYNGPNFEVAIEAQRAHEETVANGLASQVKNGEVALSKDLPFGDTWLKTMHTYLQAWVKSFSPTMRIVVLGVQQGNVNRARTWYYGGTHYVYVPKEQNKVLALYVLAHEFGHMLVSQHVNDPRYVGIKDKLINEYSTLIANTGGTAMEFVERFRSPVDVAAGAVNVEESAQQFMNDAGPAGLTFDEWLADQFVRYVHTNQSHLTVPEAKSFWKPLFEQLKGFFNLIVKKFAPSQTYSNWVESLRMTDSQMAATLMTAPPSPRVDKSVSFETNDRFEYVTRVLSRLPNKPSIKKVTIYGELARPDVKKQEREMIGRILHDWPGESVDAQLFKERVQGELVPLTLRTTNQYAAYGLSELGYNMAMQHSDVTPETHIWEGRGIQYSSPHFSADSDQYWAHARGFVTFQQVPGTYDRSPLGWNIVELQSDLEQHEPDPMGEDRAELDRQVEDAQEKLEVLKQFEKALGNKVEDFNLELFEEARGTNVITRAGTSNLVGRVLWDKLAILPRMNEMSEREAVRLYGVTLDELGAEVVMARLRLEEAQAAVANPIAPVPTALPKNWWELILRHESTWAARQGFTRVRMASADPVAKVESWPVDVNSQTMMPELRTAIQAIRLSPVVFRGEEYGQRFKDYQNSLGAPTGKILIEGDDRGAHRFHALLEVVPEGTTKREDERNVIWVPVPYRGEDYGKWAPAAMEIPRDIADAIVEWMTNPQNQTIVEEYQGIYRRYKNDITKFVTREFNAKPVTDDRGNTWLEWPTTKALADMPIVYYNTAKAVGEATEEIARASGVPELPATFVRFQGFLQNTLQLNQMAKMLPGVIGLQRYRTAMRSLHALKAKLFEGPNERIHEWHKLGRVQAKRVEQALRDEQLGGEHWTALVQTEVEGRQVWVHIPTASFDKFMKDRGITKEGQELFLGVKNDYLSTLTAMEEVVRKHTEQFFEKNEVVLAQRLAKINDEFAQLRATPYLPDMRFGKYSVQVRAGHPETVDGREIKKGELVYWEKFESERLRNKRLAELKTQLRGHNVSGSYDSDLVSTMRGLPQSVMEAVTEVLNGDPATTLTPEQTAALEQVAFDQTAAGKFAKYLGTPAKHIAGASKDMRRAYAAYHWKTANAIAKLKYFRALTGAMNSVRADAKSVRTQGGVSDPYDKLAEYMQKNFSYVMNPQHEFEQLRAFVSLWYLWGSAKTAVMNLTSVPVLTYPYLWARFGALQSQAALLRATKDVANYWRDSSKVSPDKQRFLEQLKADGVTDQSFASMLASVSDGGVAFEKIIPSFGEGESVDVARRLAWKVTSLGMMPFRAIEQLNRQVTGLAAYDLMVGKTGKTLSSGDVEAYNFARDAVDYTQNEYGAWNRPPLMQGKQSIFLLFFSFVQNMSFLMFGGDKSWWRAMLVLGTLAGLQGLPGMDNLIDMFNWVARKLSGQHVDLRNEAREVVRNIGMNPDVVMHGISHNWLGLGWDTSTSVGAGRIIPGTDAIFGVGKFEDRFLHATSEVGGPVGSLMLSFLQALADDNPSQLLRWDRALPPVLRNIEKTYGALTADAWVNARGRPIADDPTGAELVGQALGFAPTRRTERTEELRAVKDIVEFYKERRTNLMEMLWSARRTHDAGVVADVRATIAEFNSGVPSTHLRITSEDIAASMKYREKLDVETATMRSPQKRYRDIYRYIDELY